MCEQNDLSDHGRRRWWKSHGRPSSSSAKKRVDMNNKTHVRRRPRARGATKNATEGHGARNVDKICIIFRYCCIASTTTQYGPMSRRHCHDAADGQRSWRREIKLITVEIVVAGAGAGWFGVFTISEPISSDRGAHLLILNHRRTF